MNEDVAVALIFGVAGFVACFGAIHRSWRKAHGRPWFNGHEGGSAAYLSTPALVIYAFASWATTIALLS